MKINSPNLFLAATTILVASTFSTYLPAQALTWTFNNGTVAGVNPVTGSFTIDNESGTSPSIIFSNIMIDSLTFTAADIINISLMNPNGSGIEAIDWLNGSNSLSLVFGLPLTTAGGTILLNDTVSDFNGDAVSGSVTGVPEPLTLLGSATAIGFGVFCKQRLKRKVK